ncbi:MAG: DUF2243 domain-containing protein [Dehalococcoidia bacterium]|nr:DUF2243 domain-containing protein [Dehalococcoidia bacterium]
MADLRALAKVGILHTVQRRPLLTSGILLGIGFGGFFDGIIFHQLLQWHHMLTAHDDGRFPMTTIPGLETNTFWDGLFHIVCWTALAIGSAMLWRLERQYDVRWSLPLLGVILMGWGGFNVVEGLVNHQILGIHHVRDDLGGPIEWDLGFLAWGALFLVGGWYLARKSEPRPGLSAD